MAQNKNVFYARFMDDLVDISQNPLAFPSGHKKNEPVIFPIAAG